MKKRKTKLKKHSHKYLGDDSDMVCIAPGACNAKHMTKVFKNGQYQWEWVPEVEFVKPKRRKKRRA